MENTMLHLFNAIVNYVVIPSFISLLFIAKLEPFLFIYTSYIKICIYFCSIRILNLAVVFIKQYSSTVYLSRDPGDCSVVHATQNAVY